MSLRRRGAARPETAAAVARYEELKQLGYRKDAGHALWLGENDWAAVRRARRAARRAGPARRLTAPALAAFNARRSTLWPAASRTSADGRNEERRAARSCRRAGRLLDRPGTGWSRAPDLSVYEAMGSYARHRARAGGALRRLPPRPGRRMLGRGFRRARGGGRARRWCRATARRRSTRRRRRCAPRVALRGRAGAAGATATPGCCGCSRRGSGWPRGGLNGLHLDPVDLRAGLLRRLLSSSGR